MKLNVNLLKNGVFIHRLCIFENYSLLNRIKCYRVNLVPMDYKSVFSFTDLQRKGP